MIYRDERVPEVEGVWNRATKFKTKRVITIYADGGLVEAVDYLDKNPGNWRSKCSRTNGASQSWDLNTGYDKALKLAKDGWEEGMDALSDALAAVIPASGRESRWGWSQVGTSVNIGRHLHGHPKSMRSRRKKTMGSAPVLHVACNMTASCMVTGQQMANYGAAIAGLIDRLENSGKRVHLDMFFAIYIPNSGKAFLQTGWNVKRASEHVDLAALAFSIAHPASFRRLGFALMERTPRDVENSCYGYSADLIRSALPDATEATMLLDGVSHSPDRCNDVKDALRLAVEQINKAAVLAGHTTPDMPLIDEDEALNVL